MKKLSISIISLLLEITAVLAATPDFSKLTEENHPRLFADDAEFARMKSAVSAAEPTAALSQLHSAAMRLAENAISATPLEYVKDVSGRRILFVSRRAIRQIFSCAYAYRFTQDERFLKSAERDIVAVCSFKDWNPSHYLDCAEMATAVSIGYDWLYGSLSEETKALAVEKLYSYAFGTVDFPNPGVEWQTSITNWNQVCNAGLACAALATFESNPTAAEAMVKRCVESNRPVMKQLYGPDGVYSEGPVYWCYGTMFQTLLLSALESTLGTDFGLGGTEGFDRTGDFRNACDGNTGYSFNYADNLPIIIPAYPLWYLAWRFNKPYLVWNEIKRSSIIHVETERLLPLYIVYASRLDASKLKPGSETTYFGVGRTSVTMTRGGFGSDDAYLASKGGPLDMGHGHLDAGEFIYEYNGVRWACDVPRQEYPDLEVGCRKLGGNLWDVSQGSVRWKLFRYNNRQHNTLTINDKDHDVNGSAKLVKFIDEPSRKGVCFDITDLFYGDVESAVRSTTLEGGKYLRVEDCIKGGASDALVRWTLATEADVEVRPDCIILSAKGHSMTLKVSGAEVNYKQWSSDPAYYGSPTAFFDKAVPQKFCGFEFTVPAGKTITVVSTLAQSTRIEARPTFNNCSLKLEPSIEGAVMEYRKAKGQWTAAADFKGSLMGLEEDTEYEVRFLKDGAVLSQTSFRTWASKVKVGRTIEIDPAGFKAPLVISDKGTADSWVRYTVKGGKLENNTDKEAIIIDGAQYVILDGITIRGGRNCTRSILVKNGKGIRICNCDIAGWGREGVQNFQRLTGDKRFGAGNGSYVDAEGNPINLDPAIEIGNGASEIVVERCFIHDPVSRCVSWYYHHPEGPNAILMGRPEHSTVIRYNDFIGSDSHLWNDAVEGLDNFKENGGFNRDADIYGNFMIFANDDCIELDGGQRNIRCYENRFEGALVGVSVQGCMVGPSFVYNNWFTGLGEEFGIYGQTVKTGGGQHGRDAYSYIYDNVFWGDGAGIVERPNLGTVVNNNIFCGSQTIRKSAGSERSSDSGNVFNADIPENEIDNTYPKRPLDFTLDKSRISVGLSREPVEINISGRLPKGCTVRKTDADDWFSVSLKGRKLIVTFDDSKMNRRHNYRGAFILRSPEGLSRPVSIYAETPYIPQLHPDKPGLTAQYISDFSLKSGEKKSVRFKLDKPGRYWIMLHGKIEKPVNNFEIWQTRPDLWAKVDNDESERTSLHMFEYPTWCMLNPGGNLATFVRHYDLEAGWHTIELDSRDAANGYLIDEVAITTDPAAFEPNRIAP